MNLIPTAARLIVAARDEGRCVRCGGKGREWHHRRRRGVKDIHTHAACNGITTCTVCHAWCHANPKIARSMGWIVSAHDDPHETAVHTYRWGWVLLSHDGTFDLVGECEECESVTFTERGLCLSCLRKEGEPALPDLRKLMKRAEERQA